MLITPSAIMNSHHIFCWTLHNCGWGP